jgi:hypothetical protein
MRLEKESVVEESDAFLDRIQSGGIRLGSHSPIEHAGPG